MSNFIERLGWVLVHSLWQFALLATVAFVLQRALRRASSSARYLVLLGMLAAIVAAPLVTWSVLPVEAPQPVIAAAPAPVPMPIPPALPREVMLAPTPVASPPAPLEVASIAPVAVSPPVASVPLPELPQPTWSERIQEAVTPWLSTIVWGWSLGVLAFAMRPLLGWFTVRRLRTHGVSPVPEAVQAALAATAQRLGITQAVRVLQSAVVQVPIVAGYFKPVILLPVSIVTGMPASQLEAILAHELAHIRRHDYLVNLAQTLIETIFFYHPAVWWLSHQIRCERENCCDDIAVSALGSRLDYSRALLALEELRATQTPLALGANGGSLVSRVRRLFGREPERRTPPNGSMALGATLIVGILTLAAIAAAGPNETTDNKPHESDISPPTLIAKLPGGLEVELVGITRNTAPAREGWQPNGTPLSGVSGWRVDLVTQEGETAQASTENDPRADRDARDLLLHLRGLKGQRPSIFISTPSGSVSNGQWLPNDDPFEIRLPVGRSERFQVSSSQGGPLKKVVLQRAWQPQPEDPQLTIGITIAPWGTPVKIRPDGVILNPTQPGDLYADTYKLVEVLKAVATNGSWITIRQPPTHVDPANRLHAYDFEFYAIDTEGGRHSTGWRQEFPNGKYDVWLSSHGGLHELPDGKTLSHYEYRVRPYRDWVTFSGLAMEPGKMTKAKVISASYDPPQRGADQKPLVAKLPGGLEVELVGVTKNFAPLKEGWKPDGSPIGEVPDWKATTVISRQGDSTTIGGKGPPHPDARDILVEMRGLQSQPAFTLLDVQAAHGWGQLPHADPYRNRLSLLLIKPSDTLTFRMAISDAPWGPYQQVSPDGKLLSQVETVEPEKKHYESIRVIASSQNAERDTGQLTIEVPSRFHERYQLEVLAIDLDGKEHSTLHGSSQAANSPTITLECRPWEGIPIERIARWEYRLRPFRHLITFENVSFERGTKTEPKVTVETVAEPRKKYTAQVPGGIEVELLGTIRELKGGDRRSLAPDGSLLPSLKPYLRHKGDPFDDSQFDSFGIKEFGDQILYQVRGGDSPSVDLGRGSETFNLLATEKDAVQEPIRYLISKSPLSKESMTFHVKVTDEPWGEWIQVDPTGRILNPESRQTRHATYYDKIVIGLAETEVELKRPPDFIDYCKMQIRAISKENQPLIFQPGKRLTVNNVDYVERFEFRLQPYRHLVKFENVSLDPEKPTEPKVSVESIVPPELSVTLPDGSVLELLGMTTPPIKVKRPDERTWWQANGTQLADPVENPNNLGLGEDQADGRQALFRLTSQQSDASLHETSLETKGWSNSATSHSPPTAKEPSRLISIFAFGPIGDATTTTLEVRVATASWTAWKFDLAGKPLDAPEVTGALTKLRSAVEILRAGPEADEVTIWTRPFSTSSEAGESKLIAIDIAGKEHVNTGGFSDVNQEQRAFRLSPEEFDHFELRVRPFGPKVKFENVSLQPGKKTEPKVSVLAVDDAKDSQQAIDQQPRIELIGLTYDTVPKKETWQTNGQPLPAPEWVQQLPKLDGDDKGQPAPLFLFEVHGLRAKPSFRHRYQPAVVSGDDEPPEGRPYRMAVLYEDLKANSFFWGEHLAVRISDEPWGPWRTITKEGLLEGPLDPGTPYPEGYGQVTAHGLRPLTKKPNDPERDANDPVQLGLVLRAPQGYEYDYAVEIESVPKKTGPPPKPYDELFGRAVSSDRKEGKERWNVEWEWPVDPDNLNYIRYRIRPYRHRFEFQEVSGEPVPRPATSAPFKVIHTKLEHDMPKPVAAQTKATLPGGLELELLGVTPHRGTGQDGWTPQGLKFEKAPDWAGGLKLQPLPPGEMGDSANEAYRDFIVRARGFSPEQLALLPFSQKIESGDSSIGRMQVLTYNQQVQRLRIGIPGEWGPYRVLTVDPNVVPKAPVVKMLAKVHEPFRKIYDSVQLRLEASDAREERWGRPLMKSFPPDYRPGDADPDFEPGSRVRVVWKGLPTNPDLKYATHEAFVIDLERKSHKAIAKTTFIEPEGGQHWEVDIFNVPISQVSHVEYHLRPYQHVVTFNNVALHPGAKCGPNVVVESPLDDAGNAKAPPAPAVGAEGQPAPSPAPSLPKQQPQPFTIEPVNGRVLLPNGQPAVGVPVVLRRTQWGRHQLASTVEMGTDDPHDLARTVTDAQGGFAFRDVPVPDSYRNQVEVHVDVVARQDGHSLAWSRVIVGTPVTLTLQPEATLTGRVTGPSGEPVAGAVIQAAWMMSLRHITQADLEEGRWPSWKDRSFVGLTDCQLAPTAKTNENGEFVLSGVPRGLGVRLFVRSEEFEPQWFDAATGPITGENLRLTKRPVASGPLTIRMTTPRERLAIRIVDDATGVPLEGAKVVARPSGRLPVSQSGNEHVFRLAAGDVSISAELPLERGYLRGWGVFDAGQTHSAEIRLPRGIPLRGRVIDQETNQAQAGIEVRVDGRLDEIQIGNANLWSKTGSDGTFDLLLAPGKHVVWVPAFQTRYRDVGVSMLGGQFAVKAHQSATIDTSQLPDTLELALERAEGIEGVVLDPQGELAAGVHFRGLYKTDYEAQSIGDVTNEQGEFIISQLFGKDPIARAVPLDVLFWDEQRGLVGSLRVDPVVPSVAHEVQLTPMGRLSGRVVDDQGKPVAHALVQCGIELPSFGRQTGAVIARPVRTGADGRFEILSGVAGYTFDIDVERPGYVRDWKEFSLAANERDKELGDIVLEIEQPVRKLTVELPPLQGLTPDAQYTALSRSFDALVQRVEATRKVARNYDVVPDNTSRLYAQAMWNVAQSPQAGETEWKALLWMVRMSRLTGNPGAEYEKLMQQAGARLIETYADRPEIAAEADSVAWTQYGIPEGTHRAALVLLEKSPDRTARGVCCLLAAESLLDWGYAASKPIKPETITRVEPLLQRVVSEFADLPHDSDWRSGTIGDCARGWLETLKQVQQGVAVLDMVWKDTQGQPLRISDFKGKVVVLDVGTLGDDGYSRTLLNQAGPDRVVVIQVSHQNVEEAWKALDGLTIPRRQISHEEANRFERMWNIRTWPSAIVLNERGGVEGDDLREKLPQVLASVLESKATGVPEVNHHPELPPPPPPPLEFRLVATAPVKEPVEFAGQEWFRITGEAAPDFAGKPVVDKSALGLPVERLSEGKEHMGLVGDTPATSLPWDGTWHVEKCEVQPDPNGEDRFTINVTLDDAGGKALRTLTTSALRQRLAILVEERILVAPTIQEPIGTTFVITGNFSKEQAESLAKAIRRGMAQAVAQGSANGRPPAKTP